MRERGGGSVVMVASMVARQPQPVQGGYAISKGALLTATRVLAYELGPSNVRVNAVVPGWMAGPSVDIYIEMTSTGRGVPAQVVVDELNARVPLGRIPSDEDVAGAIVYLASDLSPRHDRAGARHQRRRDLRLSRPRSLRPHGRSSDRSWSGQVPSPPLGVHERGSQGCQRLHRACRRGEGRCCPPVPTCSSRRSARSCSWLRRTLHPRRCRPCSTSASVAVGPAWLTLKSVPVTTVTCEPGFTWVGSSAMITAPDMELATAWAAASSAGVFDE